MTFSEGLRKRWMRLGALAPAVCLAVLAWLFGSGVPSAQAASKSAVLVIDANSGRTLHESSANEPRFPASLTKMMTLYVVFDLIEQGRLSYQTKIKISASAAAAQPSKLGLDEGEEIALLEAMKVLITKSANDIAMAIAEHIAGSEEKFARLMTQKARQIGMASSTFRNASGLPDEAQVTTARDMITLALRLQDDFPQHYPLFATQSVTYNGETFVNHNTMLSNYEGTDGIKTGYTRASGFNLVASVKRGRKHVIGVIFGGASAASRNAAMRTFLNMALVKASTEKTRQPAPILIARPKPADAKVAAGAKKKAEPKVAAAAAKAPPTAASAAAPAPPPTLRETVADEAPAAAAPTPSSPIAIAKVRPVLVSPRAPGDPAETASIKSLLDERPAPPRPAAVPFAQASAGGFDPVVEPAPRVTRGATPSSLNEQAAKLARTQEPASPPAARPHWPATVAAAAPSSSAGGFQVQIGAYQTPAEAERQLAAVRQKAPAQLANAAAVTQTVKQGDKLLYRARYAGFDSASATGACTELKRQNIACIVLKGE
jgi:D-alanyl-D-alanine carboxypeptidase